MPRVTFFDIAPNLRWPKIQLLAEAALRKDKRLLIHCASAEVARELDDWLWTYREESFLPHEYVAGGEALRDPEARVVIVSGEMNPNQATILVQEQPVTPKFACSFESVIDLVDHRSETALADSRQRFKDWKSYEETAVELDYRKG